LSSNLLTKFFTAITVVSESDFRIGHVNAMLSEFEFNAK